MNNKLLDILIYIIIAIPFVLLLAIFSIFLNASNDLGIHINILISLGLSVVIGSISYSCVIMAIKLTEKKLIHRS